MSNPSDLVSLANAKLWLGASSTTDDAITSIIITSVSQQILGYLGRTFILPRSYTEVRNPNKWHDSIMLRQWPVISVSSLVINGQVIPVSPVPMDATAYQPGYVVEQIEQSPPGRPGLLFLRGICPGWSKQSVVIEYSAGYQISSEAQTIPASPYLVLAAQPYGYWASDAGVQYAATGQNLVAVSSVPVQGQYNVAAGAYTFSAADANAQVLISYGYVPYALSEACMEWVGERMRYRMRIGTDSKTLGGQETVQFASNAMPTMIKETLAPYRARFTPQ